MPMWTIYVPQDAYSRQDLQDIANVITDLYEKYVKIPRFYVSVAFHEQPTAALFMGGILANNFVRIWIDHAARHLDDDTTTVWLNIIDTALAPFIRDRGFDYEIHGDETPRAFWAINGMTPPPHGSEHEERWKADNRPSALTEV
jgi:phenylpyruvate tautomerase PptA (4-oxalocrotonate tautomerase family)